MTKNLRLFSPSQNLALPIRQSCNVMFPYISVASIQFLNATCIPDTGIHCRQGSILIQQRQNGANTIKPKKGIPPAQVKELRTSEMSRNFPNLYTRIKIHRHNGWCSRDRYFANSIITTAFLQSNFTL